MKDAKENPIFYSNSNIIEYTAGFKHPMFTTIEEQYGFICESIDIHGQQLEDKVFNTLLERKNKRELDSLINEE
jgi:hypothetical protein